MERIRGEEYRTTTVCIDSYDNAILAGRLHNPYLKEGKPFQSGTQFLIEMERLLDQMNFPASFTAARMFAPVSQRPEQSLPQPPPKGVLTTFSIRILFRQHASWQGSLVWLEGRQEESFRSVLELLLLMDSAIQANKKAS